MSKRAVLLKDRSLFDQQEYQATPDTVRPRSFALLFFAMPEEIPLILVLDADQQLGRLTTLVLDEAGFQARYVQTPSEALTFWDLLKQHIVLVLVDLSIPGMEREHFLSKIFTEKPSIRILFTGSDTALSKQTTTLLNEGSNFLRKPLVYSELVDLVKRNIPQD